MALPKFSGQYYRGGGAYENPQAVVDNKTGLLWAQAISQMGQNTTNALNQLAAKKSAEEKRQQAILDRNRDFVLNKQEQYFTNLKEQGVNNPTVYSNVNKLMDLVSYYNIEGMSAKTREEQQAALNKQAKYQSNLSTLMGLIQAGNDADTQWRTDNIDNVGTMGEQGGVATVGQGEYYPIYNEAMSVRNGMGGTEQFYLDEAGNWRIRYNSASIDKEHTLPNGEPGIDVMAATFLGFDPGKVPEIDKEIRALLSEASDKNTGGLGILDKNNNITTSFLNYDGADFNLVANGKATYYSTPINASKVNGLLLPQLKAKANSYLKSPQQAQIIWKQVLGNETDLEMSSGNVGGSIFSTEAQTAFIEQFSTYAMSERFIPKSNVSGLSRTQSKSTGGNGTEGERENTRINMVIDNAWNNKNLDILKGFKGYKIEEVEGSEYNIFKPKYDKNGEEVQGEYAELYAFNLDKPEDINVLKNIFIGAGNFNPITSITPTQVLTVEAVTERIANALSTGISEEEFIDLLDEQVSLTVNEGDDPQRLPLSEHLSDAGVSIDYSDWDGKDKIIVNANGKKQSFVIKGNDSKSVNDIVNFITSNGKFVVGASDDKGNVVEKPSGSDRENQVGSFDMTLIPVYSRSRKAKSFHSRRAPQYTKLKEHLETIAKENKKTYNEVVAAVKQGLKNDSTLSAKQRAAKLKSFEVAIEQINKL